MSEYKSRSRVNNDQPQEASKVVELATRQLAVERACRLIDIYVLEVRQEPPASEASQYADGT